MNSNPHCPIDRGTISGSAEETLRLIARLPAPAGLEDRIEAALRSTPRRSRVLAWPITGLDQPWIRAAAAAAIAFVVIGGGWGVYTHVERQQAAKITVTPAPAGPAARGFSSAGAIRTPQTLNGPVLVHPADAATREKPAAGRSGQSMKSARKKPHSTAQVKAQATAASKN